MKTLAPNLSVNFVNHDGKTVKGKIESVTGGTSARIVLDKEGDHVAFAEFSEEKTSGTFHFPEEPASSKPKTAAPATADK
jgi:hypothetical protein